jgi:DNA-binding transcriptional MerR regulator
MTDRLTIEELAQKTGMSTRNIREHQTRGLLPPPTLEGRKGYYDDRHVARIELIQDLQSEGLNLQAIAWLLERAPADLPADEVLRLKHALFAPWGDEERITLDATELDARWGEAITATELARAVELGILRPLDRGRWEIVQPRLLSAGEELVDMGIPVAVALDVVETVAGHADAIAERFVALFTDEIWEPFATAGFPAERWPEVRDALERLRPIASDAVLSLFHETMSAAVDRELTDMTARASA